MGLISGRNYRQSYTLALLLGVSFFPAATSLPAATNWTLIGWSDLGINQMERDYSLFAVYPPYGSIHAQLMDPTGVLYKGTSGVTVTYEAVADPGGSINTTSAGKTNFWPSAQALFGAAPATDTGLTGNQMPGSANVPQAMTYDGTYNRFSASGIPITPYDDSWNLNYYPLLKLTARDASGNILATARITLPVSNEVECRGCHASGANSAAQPVAGYANDGNPNRDFKLNILRLHDEKNQRNPAYQSALASLNYASSGIYATATGGSPVSCTACHASNQFNNPGMSGIESLTSAMHNNHASVIDPATNDILDNGTDRATCYHCHAGTHTQALRGAMSASIATDGSVQIQCQSCHGTLSALGDPTRNGWLDLPNCQACHIGTAATTTGVLRLTSALDSKGALNQTTDATFATTANQPTTGASLYRFSSGHGNLQCAACHGTAHAELPSAQANDNLQSLDLKGATGPIQDCAVCHQTGISSTNGGPHGMHDVGSGWVSSHSHAVGRNPSACAPCHGQDYKGTELSAAFTTRTLSIENGTIQMFRGYQVSCYTCHNGPNGGGGTQPAAPAVNNTSGSVLSGQSTTIPVSITSGGVLRIISKPLGGTAYVSGSSIVYQARANFEGTDQLTYAALNSGGRDSNLGTASVTVASAVRPVFAATGVTNAASYAPGLAPGMIAYIYGAGMGSSNLSSYELNSGGFIEKLTAGTRVLFNGIPAPLVYSSDSQVSAIVPYGVSGGTANMVVEYNGIQSSPVAVPVSPTLPGVFVPVSAAPRGSVLTLYVTGEGATNPVGVDGKLAVSPYPAPVLPVTVTIGGQAAAVQYAGGAPGEVAGLMQVNVLVPANLPAGPSPIVVSVGGTPSASGVMVDVK